MDITKKLDSIDKKVDNIEQQLSKGSTSNPILFITMVTLFFIAMAFWTTASIEFAEKLHTSRKLHYWEYAGLGSVILIFLYWFGTKIGIELNSIST